MKGSLMTELLEKQMPPKSYFVMGANWTCYIEPKKEDLENLNDEDFKVEVCTRAVEVFLGMSQNDTLAIINKEDEPMIGVVMAVTERGMEDDDESYSFVPSHLCFGNCGQYKNSAESFVAYDKFLNFIEEQRKKVEASPKTKKTKKTKPLPPKKED